MKNKTQLVSYLKSQSISVGILASHWLDFDNTLDILSSHHLNLLHFDIADGQFSPMFTVGPMAIKPFADPFIKDVHLMVKNQFVVAKECAKAGADIVTLQVESDENLNEIYLWLNNETQALSGISICPDTDLSLLKPYLDDVDLIQILALDPRTGNKMEENALLNRIKQLFQLLGSKRVSKLISVDGSMTLSLAQKVNSLGIDWIVSGSALFKNGSLEETLSEWKAAL